MASIDLRRSVGHSLFDTFRMVGDESFKMHDGDWLIELTPSAFHLAVMPADSTTYAWERVCPFDYSVSVIDAAGPNQGNVRGDVHANGASVLARASKEI